MWRIIAYSLLCGQWSVKLVSVGNRAVLCALAVTLFQCDDLARGDTGVGGGVSCLRGHGRSP